MEWGQSLRRVGRSVTQAVGAGVGAVTSRINLRWPSGRWTGRVSLVIIVALLLIYPLAAWMAHTIDDDLDFGVPSQSIASGQSHTAALMAALITREVDDHGWVPNDPWMTPTGLLLDDMPNFQKGIIQALARFSIEMQDQLGRTRGSSQIDPDLQKAAGLLQYEPERWVWNPSTSILPSASAESQYRAAARALLRYNERLAAGEAVFDLRADNLLTALDRIAQDVGSASAAIEDHILARSGFFYDNAVDDVFYRVKGQMYGFALILGALGEDFAPIIKERSLGKVWTQMMESVREASSMHPWFIMNGAPDSQFTPCHLCAEGFYVLRARTQMREVTSILQK